MKTIADLKRDLKVGSKVELLERFGSKVNEIREVTKLQSNAIAFKKGDKLSWLYLPKASLIDYDGEYITIYQAGERDLTEHEQSIINNEPSKRPENKEQVKNEMLSDGNSFYFLDRAYYKNLDMEYLQGHKFMRGLKLNFNTNKIIDEKIKGNIELKYKVI